MRFEYYLILYIYTVLYIILYVHHVCNTFKHGAVVAIIATPTIYSGTSLLGIVDRRQRKRVLTIITIYYIIAPTRQKAVTVDDDLGVDPDITSNLRTVLLEQWLSVEKLIDLLFL